MPTVSESKIMYYFLIRSERFSGINELKQESNTWRLIETVYKDRYTEAKARISFLKYQHYAYYHMRIFLYFN